MKILYSGYRDSRHSESGGYDRIIRHPETSCVLLKEHFPLGSIKIESHWARIPLMMLDIATRFLRYRYDVTHLFYGEISMLFFLPYLRSKRHKIVITLHLDLSTMRFPALFLKLLRRFDGVVVLSNEHRQQLKQLYGIDSVFIPHGFSNPRFVEKRVADKRGVVISDEKINVAVIGKMYRDFSLLHRVVAEINDNRFHFHLIGVAIDEVKELELSENVSIYRRLDDDEYYSLLAACDYNFMPLTFATANNTLLEAQSLGVKSILPRISGISDYAAPEPLNLYYDAEVDLIGLFRTLDKSKRSSSLVEYMQRFDWSRVYRQLSDYYSTLFE